FGDWQNRFYALNPKSGKPLWIWSNNKSNRMLSPAAVWPVKAHGKVFIVTPERVTYALSAVDGREVWSAKGGRESIGIASDGNAVYVKTMQDSVFAWSTLSDTPVRLWSSFAGFGYEIAPSPITVHDGLLFVPTDKGNIFALRESDGALVWKYKFSIALINYIQPIAGNRLLVTSMDGKVGVLQL
ncbi:MAG TPA: PQQ-binding-like beta-propeller repeat protein, partial [Bacteroidales bacterium]|nr:PQQ-binding-like beta-propeller repeat protein [Bacteroidales bacterium]